MGKHTHYLDINGKYEIDTDEKGRKQMDELEEKVEKYIGEMKLGEDEKEEGKRIYKEKNFVGSVTWTDEDYKNRGFMYWYLKIKSKQRYTEIYSLFEKIKFEKKLRIVSVGGGPGFELEALKKLGYGNVINLDKGPWRDFSNFLGTEYHNFDFFKDDLSVYNPDIIILSYVFSNYLNNEEGLKIIMGWLEFTDYIVINDRKRKIELFDGMENIYRVLSHNDDRQVILSKKFRLYNQQYNLTFKNIPYKFHQNNGNILHTHFSGYVRYNTLLNYIEENKNMFYLEEDKKSNYELHYVSENSRYKTPNDFNVDSIREYINKLWMSTEDVYHITRLGGLFYFVIKNIDFMPVYVKMIHEQLDKEGVKKCELRLKLGTYFSSKGRVPIEEELKLLHSMSKGRFKIIAQSSKNMNWREAIKYFSLVRKIIFNNNFTNFVIGFDLVGDEFRSRPLSYHSKLFGLYYFLLHAGEGLQSIHCDNLDFVVKRNLCERIGHGIAILKKPELIPEIKKKDICLEFTPIGYLITNQLTTIELKQLLKLVLDNDVKCIVSPDDVNKYFDSDIEENLKLIRQLGFTSKNISSFIHTSFSYTYSS